MKQISIGKQSFSSIREKNNFASIKRVLYGNGGSLMLASGYLKVLYSEFPADGRFRYELGVTTFEVKIMLQPLMPDGMAYILEFKVYSADEEQGLRDTVAAALKQIEEKQYDAELLVKGFAPEQIRHYGFAFRGKEVLIG